MTLALPRLVVFLSIVLALIVAAKADDPSKRLEVKLTQSGYAGETGSLWVIDPSGTWSRQDIAVGHVEPVEAKNTGTLTKEQLDRLAQVLRQNEIGNLPERLGSNTRANPRKLTIRWGDKMVEVVTPAAVDPTRSSGRRPEDQAAAIARTVQELTQK
jgi:hypothetical protein